MRKFPIVIASHGSASRECRVRLGRPRNYLIVAKSQGAGAPTWTTWSPPPAARSQARRPEIGVVFATSNNPDFLRLVVRDALVQQAPRTSKFRGSPGRRSSGSPSRISNLRASTPNPIGIFSGTSDRSRPTRRPPQAIWATALSGREWPCWTPAAGPATSNSRRTSTPA